MGLNIYAIQKAILQHLRSKLPQSVYLQAIPQQSTLKRGANGKIVPYVTVQFGSPREIVTSRPLTGVRSSDQEVMIYVQAVAADPEIAAELAYDKVLSALLGFQSEGTGELRNRPGGAVWGIEGSNSATEAYISPTSYGLTVQTIEK